MSGHTAIVGAVSKEGACEIGIGDVRTFSVTRNTAGIMTRDAASDTAVLDVRAAAVRIAGAHDAADVVAARSVLTLYAGVNHQTVTDIHRGAAARKTGDTAHHASRLQHRVNHHQRVDGTGVLQRAEQACVEGAPFITVQVVDRVAMTIEIALEGVASSG